LLLSFRLRSHPWLLRQRLAGGASCAAFGSVESAAPNNSFTAVIVAASLALRAGIRAVPRSELRCPQSGQLAPPAPPRSAWVSPNHLRCFGCLRRFALVRQGRSFAHCAGADFTFYKIYQD